MLGQQTAEVGHADPAGQHRHPAQRLKLPQFFLVAGQFDAEGVGDHILNHVAQRDQQHGAEVLPLGDHHGGHQAVAEQGAGNAEQQIRRAVAPKDRKTVAGHAHHHLAGPGQAEPEADAGDLGRGQAQVLLQEHGGHADQRAGAVGEIHRQHRQPGQPNLAEQPGSETALHPHAAFLLVYNP